jgi:hypothetical protein
MEPIPQPEGALTGNVLLYSSPEPLNKDLHAKLGVVPSDSPYGFARTANAVPIHVTEFGIGAVSFPIIFAGAEKQPLAVLGLREGENLFVDDKGVWEIGAYVPSFVRRYPFVLANDEKAERLVVCIDRSAPFLSEEGSVKLFENGEPSAYTQNALKFCETFEAERQRTESFVKLLSEHDLFETKQTHYAPPNPDGTQGAPVVVSEYWSISEAKLGALPAETLKTLQDNGALGQIYAHLLSLASWDKLLAKTLSMGLVFAPSEPTPTPAAANA